MIEGDQRRVRPTPAGVETHRRGINIHLDTTPTLDLREKTLETEEANNIRLSFRDMCKRAINPVIKTRRNEFINQSLKTLTPKSRGQIAELEALEAKGLAVIGRGMNLARNQLETAQSLVL
ncbi:hypothetical protein HID58_032793 [Brassica napus]|uniref:Uncharacterized protein n=1 Tax=Brassica napus TaxID=3708 RepID=A0ABQ8BY93_BRANA|nr:hypothetical protein HID58_032793 [Brassica napus]